MNYLVGLHTDIGLIKPTNQDSMCIKEAITDKGNVLFALLCDGMGGLEKGEVASATVIHRLANWFDKELSELLKKENPINEIRYRWDRIIKEENNNISDYGHDHYLQLGTTASMILILEDGQYIIGHVGDSRVYHITNNTLDILTDDHTLVNLEVKKGRLTEEEANHDPRRSVLLQCIGASNVVNPEYTIGQCHENECFMLCSDGFRHELSAKEIYDYCTPLNIHNEDEIKNNLIELVEINKQRKETDNISAMLIKVI